MNKEMTMKKITLWSFLSFIIISSLACGPLAYAAKAAADIKGTAEGSNLSGRVEFDETPAGLTINGKFTNVPAGKHGFHIHENGSCGDAGKAAGGHFNPDNHPHGNLLEATL